MTRASVSLRRPRAHAICDRCGFRYNHDELQWQFQWAGPKLQNLRLLVCKSCLDVPQEGLRTIILPPDPVPIENPRPENYANANNPNSPIGQAPVTGLIGSNIGNLIGGAGTYSAFMGSSQKTALRSAYLAVSNSSFNWVGKDWSAYQDTVDLPTTIESLGLSLTATSFEARAPTDMPFLASGAASYYFQGSTDATTWTTLSSGATSTSAGETISGDLASGVPYRYHRLAIVGDGVSQVAVAWLAIDTDRGYSGSF